jgi:hypothetical protein
MVMCGISAMGRVGDERGCAGSWPTAVEGRAAIGRTEQERADHHWSICVRRGVRSH